jgi:formylglycine-generating enzyme required for sulfatase activity
MRITRVVLLAGLLLHFIRPDAFAADQNTPAPPKMEGMGYVPGGDFWMGRVRLWMIDEIGWQVRERADDRPVHLVDVDAFFIDAFEVTNAQYAEFLKATGAGGPYQWGGPTPPADRVAIPIYNVSWHDAVAYCGWRGKRLPTEAEWEKAARGGLDRQDFPWGMKYRTPAPKATIDAAAAKVADPDVGDRDSTAGAPVRAGAESMVSHAWSNSAHGPTKVGSYEPNGFGLYDMSGNLWEWTSSWYDLYAYSVAERRNAAGPAHGHYKVIRGGGWLEDDSRLGSVYIRNFANPDLKAPTVGFRCAKSATTSPRD